MKRPRFLGANLPQWLLIAAFLVVVVWLCAGAWLMIEILQAITGAGSKGCL